MPSKRENPWFRVKQTGYGAGLPMAWEGWLALTIYLAVAVGSAFLLPPLATLAVLVLSTPAFVYLCYLKSDDEWRWRSPR